MQARLLVLERKEEAALKKESQSSENLKRTISQLACGGLAGACSRTLVAPIDRVKILMQTQYLVHQGQTKYNGIFHTMRTIVFEEVMRSAEMHHTEQSTRHMPGEDGFLFC